MNTRMWRTPADDLSTALSTVASFQSAVQHADDKAKTVVAIQSMLTALVAAQSALLMESGGSRVALLAVMAVFVPGYALSSFCLLRALVPRTMPPPEPNQFAFPSVANGDHRPVRVSARAQYVQAYELGRLLAGIAMVKHLQIRRAMYGTGALFASALGLLVVTVVP